MSQMLSGVDLLLRVIKEMFSQNNLFRQNLRCLKIAAPGQSNACLSRNNTLLLSPT